MKKDEGMALIIVLWIGLILSTIAISLAYTTRLQMRLSSSYRDEFIALSVARAGVEHALARLTDNETEEYDTSEEWTFKDEPFELGQGRYWLRCSDEESKLNINLEGEAVLRRLPGIDDEIVDCILDWRDKDDLHRLNGAEDPYYEGLNSPYECKDGPFDTVEELLLVKGVKRELLYGKGIDQVGLVDFITVFTDGRININTAPKEVIESSLGIGPSLAEKIIDYRRDNPFKEPEEILDVDGMGNLTQPIKNELLRKIGVSSSVFTITSTASIGNGRMIKTIKAVVDRTFSPIRIVYLRED